MRTLTGSGMIETLRAAGWVAHAVRAAASRKKDKNLLIIKLGGLTIEHEDTQNYVNN